MNRWLWCGFGCSSTFGQWYGFDAQNLSTGRVSASVECGASSCQRENQVLGRISIRNVSVAVYEDNPPHVAVEGGSAVSGGWKRGSQTVNVAASDPVGIQEVEVLLGGAQARVARHHCNFSLKDPCSSGTDALEFDTRAARDGRNELTLRATDTAGNLAQTSRSECSTRATRHATGSRGVSESGRLPLSKPCLTTAAAPASRP